MKTLNLKKSAKNERERQVLFGLIELYLQSGKPVGSNTLKDTGFEEFSSATIRNYFVSLESEGFLAQHHTSGGRVPTAKAFQLYAEDYQIEDTLDTTLFESLRTHETQQLATYLSGAAETLSGLTKTAVFLSSPRFDQDYIIDIKLVAIDQTRCLCVLVTSFGVVQTELLHIDQKLNSFSAKRIESYFKWRLAANEEIESRPENLTREEEQLAHQFYNEIMVRYIVSYTNFTDEDIYRTGFSKLLAYPDFENNSALTNCLSLFENVHAVRMLLKECTKKEVLRYWIGDELTPFSNHLQECAIIAVPYFINNQCVGAIGLLGPIRMPYRKLFEILRSFSNSVSEALTNSIYKYKIAFRQPHPETIGVNSQSHLMLLEDKRKI